MHLPLESVTTVDLPSDAVLVDKLPEPPECVTVPPGPVVVPLTLPLPAVIDVDIEVEPEGGASPFFSSTTLQLSDEDDAVPPEPVVALAVALLELVWAAAMDVPMAATVKKATSVLTTTSLKSVWMKKERPRDGCRAAVRR